MRYQKKIVIASLVCIGLFAVKKLVTDKLNGFVEEKPEEESIIDESKMTSEEICDYISQ